MNETLNESLIELLQIKQHIELEIEDLYKRIDRDGVAEWCEALNLYKIELQRIDQLISKYDHKIKKGDKYREYKSRHKKSP